jgi:hypothetical protein
MLVIRVFDSFCLINEKNQDHTHRFDAEARALTPFFGKIWMNWWYALNFIFSVVGREKEKEF